MTQSTEATTAARTAIQWRSNEGWYKKASAKQIEALTIRMAQDIDDAIERSIQEMRNDD